MSLIGGRRFCTVAQKLHTTFFEPTRLAVCRNSLHSFMDLNGAGGIAPADGLQNDCNRPSDAAWSTPARPDLDHLDRLILIWTADALSNKKADWTFPTGLASGETCPLQVTTALPAAMRVRFGPLIAARPKHHQTTPLQGAIAQARHIHAAIWKSSLLPFDLTPALQRL